MGRRIVVSCSDRPIRHQQDVWERHEIVVDFTVLKHRLAESSSRRLG